MNEKCVTTKFGLKNISLTMPPQLNLAAIQRQNREMGKRQIRIEID